MLLGTKGRDCKTSYLWITKGPDLDWVVMLCSFPHLQWKRRLFVVDSDKNLAHYELFAVITEQKLSTKAFIILPLSRHHRNAS